MEKDLFDIENALPQMPESFAAGAERALARIGTEDRKSKVIRLDRKRLAVLIAAAVLVLSATAFAAAGAAVLRRAGGRVGYFDGNDPAGIAAQQPHYERIGDEVNVVLTAEDVELTIDNVAVETEQLTVFYTVSSKKGIADDAALPELRASIDGGATACAYPMEFTSKRLDANTFACMQTMWLPKPLPEKCTLTVYCSELFGVEKHISAELAVDTSGVLANVSEGEYRITVDDGRYEHDIIARVYIDADGGVLELSETVPKTKYDENHNEITYLPFVDFAVFGSDGRSLNPHIDGVKHSSAAGSTATNRVRFDADMTSDSITIVPMRITGEAYADLMLDEIGTAHTVGGAAVTLTAAEFDEEAHTLTVSYTLDGVYPVGSRRSINYFIGPDGNRLECGDVATSEEVFRDDATGVYTQTIEFWTRKFDMGLVKGIRFFCYTTRLEEDNMLTIPISGK